MGTAQACLTENLSFAVEYLGRKTEVTTQKNTE